MVAIKDNEVVYSDTWNDYKEDDCTHIMSATKSIMALLIGIAVDKGKIGSVDDKVLDYFPDYKVKRGEKTIYDVTIKHLLTMRAPYKGKGDPWSKVCASDNWTYSSLDFLGGRKGLTDGLGTPGYGLCMSAEDMVKIGLLCLNKGCFNNKQIVSSSWIEEISLYIFLLNDL